MHRLGISSEKNDETGASPCCSVQEKIQKSRLTLHTRLIEVSGIIELAEDGCVVLKNNDLVLASRFSYLFEFCAQFLKQQISTLYS